MRLALVIAAFFGCQMFVGTGYGQQSVDSTRNRPASESRIVGQQFSLLRTMPAQIGREIEIVDYQVEELKKIEAEWRAEIADWKKQPGGKNAAERAAFIDQLCERVAQQIGATILPHQAKRLRQVAVQKFIGTQPRTLVEHLLANPIVREELELDSSTLERIRKSSAEINRQLDEQIATLRKEAEAEVLSLITADQRNRLRDLIGEPYEFRKNKSDH
jgi:hypothetical protein